MTDREIVRMALRFAIDYEQSCHDAYFRSVTGTPFMDAESVKAREIAREHVRLFKRVLKNRYGEE